MVCQSNMARLVGGGGGGGLPLCVIPGCEGDSPLSRQTILTATLLRGTDLLGLPCWGLPPCSFRITRARSLLVAPSGFDRLTSGHLPYIGIPHYWRTPTGARNPFLAGSESSSSREPKKKNEAAPLPRRASYQLRL